MATTVVRRWGNSMAIRIPKHLAQKVDIDVDMEVEVLAVEGHLVLRPTRSVLTFDDLLKEHEQRLDMKKEKVEAK